jgi:hypothetical protein
MFIHHIFTGSEEDQEATEMLVGNAQNLMQASYIFVFSVFLFVYLGIQSFKE